MAVICAGSFFSPSSLRADFGPIKHVCTEFVYRDGQYVCVYVPCAEDSPIAPEVPEPSAMLLMGAGLGIAALAKRVRFQ